MSPWVQEEGQEDASHLTTGAALQRVFPKNKDVGKRCAVRVPVGVTGGHGVTVTKFVGE